MDDDGRRTGVRYPGGATKAWVLDDPCLPSAITGSAGGGNQLGVTLGYTDAIIAAQTGNPSKDTGLVTSIRDGVETRTTGYSYDALTGSPSSLTSPTVDHGGLRSRPR